MASASSDQINFNQLQKLEDQSQRILQKFQQATKEINELRIFIQKQVDELDKKIQTLDTGSTVEKVDNKAKKSKTSSSAYEFDNLDLAEEIEGEYKFPYDLDEIRNWLLRSHFVAGKLAQEIEEHEAGNNLEKNMNTTGES